MLLKQTSRLLRLIGDIPSLPHFAHTSRALSLSRSRNGFVFILADRASQVCHLHAFGSCRRQFRVSHHRHCAAAARLDDLLGHWRPRELHVLALRPSDPPPSRDRARDAVWRPDLLLRVGRRCRDGGAVRRAAQALVHDAGLLWLARRRDLVPRHRTQRARRHHVRARRAAAGTGARERRPSDDRVATQSRCAAGRHRARGGARSTLRECAPAAAVGHRQHVRDAVHCAAAAAGRRL